MSDGALASKVAIVTGAGGGIGKAIAAALAGAGARVAVTELPEKLALAEEAATEIRADAAAAAAGGDACAFPLDVRDLASIDALVAAVVAQPGWGGRIDLLVNNAGINVRQAAFDVTEEAWDAILATNLKGLFFVAQRVGRRMRDQNPAGGAIVNVASIMGLVGYKDRAAYCAAKAGVVNLSRVLAFEWAPHGIRVNALCPTFVVTPMTAPLLEDPVAGGDLLARTPLGRFAEPEDVAQAAIFLATAPMVTGHALAVDGGWLAV